jgi:hypothetical protein
MVVLMMMMMMMMMVVVMMIRHGGGEEKKADLQSRWSLSKSVTPCLFMPSQQYLNPRNTIQPPSSDVTCYLSCACQVSVELLKSVTEYSSCSAESTHVRHFWQVRIPHQVICRYDSYGKGHYHRTFACVYSTKSCAKLCHWHQRVLEKYTDEDRFMFLRFM